MPSLRHLPPRSLALGAVLTVTAAGGAAIALGATGAAPPPAKPLDVAVRDALAAPPVAGVTARIAFKDKLIDASSLPAASPLLKGATGRLWASRDGRLRLELQSEGGGGDAQVLVDGRRFSVYEPASDTVYRGELPEGEGESAGHRDERRDAVPTLAAVRSALAKLSARTDVSGAKPGTLAGRGAYTVRVSPKRDGGLLGGAELAWDAATGAPLRAAVYAADSADPVLELEATDISFGKVASADLTARPPAGAKVVDLSPPAGGPAAKDGRHGEGQRDGVSGLAAVQAKVPFRITAPTGLVGLERRGVRLISADGTPSALVLYGKGLGSVAVLESAAKPEPAAGRGRTDRPELKLPTVSINGSEGTELDTALGTLLRFDRAGVRYVVAGSVPPTAAEAAARALK